MTHHVFEVADVDAKNELVKHARLRHRPPHPLHAHQAPGQEAREAAHRSRASPPSTCTATSRRPPATATSPPSPTARRRVLVATDVAARGVHVDDVELVVHVDPPMEHKAYLHRSGRTARAGSAGDVVTVSPARAAARPADRCCARPTSRSRRSRSPRPRAPSPSSSARSPPYVKPAPRAARPAAGRRRSLAGRERPAQARGSRRPGPVVGCPAHVATARDARPRRSRTHPSRAAARAAARRRPARSADHPLARAREAAPPRRQRRLAVAQHARQPSRAGLTPTAWNGPDEFARRGRSAYPGRAVGGVPVAACPAGYTLA